MALNLDPKQVIITVGAAIVTGFADGTFVTITADSDDFTTYKGVQGTVSRANQNNTTATLKITLAQTSPSNDVFSAMRAVDVATSHASFPVSIKDLSGTTKHLGASCWFVGQPEQKYGKDVDTIEWQIQMTGYAGHIGGNFPG